MKPKFIIFFCNALLYSGFLHSQSTFVPGSSMQIIIRRPTDVYSIPTLDKTFIVDTINEKDFCLAISLVSANTQYGQIKYWHIYYKGITGYIKDYVGNIDYDFSRKSIFGFYGKDSVADAANFNSIQYDIQRQETIADSVSESLRRAIAAEEKADSIEKENERKLLLRQYKSQIGIDNFEYWYPEYSSAITISFSVTNYAKSPIKYITFYVSAFDAVGGQLTSMNQRIVKMKGIGPITEFTTGKYTFEHAFWSNVIDSMSLNKIDIEYMNGQKKSIVNPKNLIGSKK